MNLQQIAINCPTYESAKKVLAKLSELGYVWASNKELTRHSNFDMYGDRTTYWINKHKVYFTAKGTAAIRDRELITAEEFFAEIE